MNRRDIRARYCVRTSFPDVGMKTLSDQIRGGWKRSEKTAIGGGHKHSIDARIGGQFVWNPLLCSRIGVSAVSNLLRIRKCLVVADDAGSARNVVVQHTTSQ